MGRANFQPLQFPDDLYIRLSNSNFHPLEVVGRGSGTQLQVGENKSTHI